MKALALLSGGLDSMLAVRTLQQQKIQIEAVCFTSVFFGDQKAQQAAKDLKVPLLSIDITDELLSIVKSPPHGFGKGANPCIDCHILMIKTAGSLLQERGGRFLVSGEVLGERPKSQSRKALKIVDKGSGWEDYLVRPLTAKNLSPTVPEQKGWVDREKLLGIKGRSRKPQFELAKKYGIKNFPTPAGGCLLTDPNFSRRVKYILSTTRLNVNEMELLKIGRHFRLNHQTRVIVGRNEQENIKIEKLATPGDFILTVRDYPGPTALVRGNIDEETISKAAPLVVRYSDAPEDAVEVKYRKIPQGKTRIVKVRAISENVEKLRIEKGI